MQQQFCPACSQPGEPPFLFCAACGAPRIHLGRLRIMSNLMLAMTAFLGTYYFASFIIWDWPLYTFFAAFLLQFMLALVAGQWEHSSRLAVWFALFFAGFAGFYSVLAWYGDGGVFINALSFGPEAAADYPLVFYPALAAVLVVVLLPCYFRWERVYGWHNAYRIVLLTLLSVSGLLLLAMRAAQWGFDRDLFPGQSHLLRDFLGNSKPAYDHALGIFAVFVFRILLFEIFVFAAIKGHGTAQAIKLENPTRLSGESGLVRSVLILTQILRRFLLLLGQMAHCLYLTLRQLTLDLGRVIQAFFRELLVPALAMVAIGLLLRGLTVWTRSYIDENSLSAVARIFGSIVALLVFALVFIGCKTPFRWKRIALFMVELVGWLMPNLLVFFLLMSLSLYLTGKVLNGPDSDSPLFPFRLGLLTRVDAGLLVVLVGVILFRKRSLLKTEPASATPGKAAAAQTAQAAALAEDPGEEVWTAPILKQSGARAAKATPAPKPAPALARAAATERAIQAARENTGPGAKFGFFKAKLLPSARGISDRLQGKPAIVDQLAKIKQQHLEKVEQVRSLERIKGTISPEAYDNLWNQYRGELTYLAVKRDQLQAELDHQYAQRLLEKSTLEARIADLQQKENDARRLAEAGIMSEREAKQKFGMITSERGILVKDFEGCEKVLGFLAAETTPPAQSPDLS